MFKLFRKFLFSPSFTPRRFINYCLGTLSKKLFHQSVVWGYPWHLHIDPTNVCNLQCPLCPTGQGREDRPKGMMSFEHFKQIIDEVGPYLYELDMSNWGEPILNRELYRMIEYAHSYRIYVSFPANLNRISDQHIDALVRSGLDAISLSIDGASQETYSQYRVGGKFDRVMVNLKKLVAKKKELQSETPHLIWSFIMMRHNEHEVEQARQLATEIGVDEFRAIPVQADMAALPLMNADERLENVKDWLPTSSDYVRYGENSQIEGQLNDKGVCPLPWSYATINWDGGLAPCCAVYEKEFDYGNVVEEGFLKVWNNKTYQEARRAVRKNGKTDSSTICAKCARNGFVPF